MRAYLPLVAVLVALLVGLVVGKAWERYKLRDGRWVDRRRLRDTPQDRKSTRLNSSHVSESRMQSSA